MASTAVPVASRRDAVRDPVLVLPAAVAVGLAVGWLGVREHVPGGRIAADLALAWCLAGASAVALGRPSWRPARLVLAVAAFALLGADLAWASPESLSSLGLSLAWAWAALLVQLVLTFPGGRPWTPAGTGVILAAYGVAALSIARELGAGDAIVRPQAIAGIVVGIAALSAVGLHVRGLGGPTRRAQGPLLLAATVTAAAGVACLAWFLADASAASTLDTVARVVAVTVPLGAVAGILWSRLGSHAAELAVELRTDPGRSMRDRLARALADPTLELAYRLDDGRYVDAAGRPVEIPRHGERATTPLIASGEEIAVLVHDPALLEEPGLVESVRATAGLVLENERLAVQVRSQLAEVRASRGRIVAAADAERSRIERDLHDGAQQRLVTLSVSLGLEASQADAGAAEALSRAQDEVEGAIAELRELARGIHPTLLRDHGLEAAVAGLARRASLPVTVSGSVQCRVPGAVELAAYFFVSEALTNVVKHASAHEAWVEVERDADALRVTVRDDGAGGASIGEGGGLAGLKDRLDALGATLSVDSPVGLGTTLQAVFPCES
jgi:signal transduction histidine kinase